MRAVSLYNNKVDLLETAQVSEQQHDDLVRLIYQSTFELESSLGLRQLLLEKYSEGVELDSYSFNHIVGHLKRAMRIVVSRAAIKKERTQLESIVQRVVPPSLIINESQQVLSISNKAKQILNDLGVDLKSKDKPLFPIGTFNKILKDVDSHGIALERLTFDSKQERSPTLESENYREILLSLTRIKNQESQYQLVLIDEYAAFKSSITGFGDQYDLTDREKEVVYSAVMDANLHNISVELGISEQTAKQHLKNVYRKANINSLNGLIHKILDGVLIQYTGVKMSPNESSFISGLVSTRIFQLPDQRQISYVELGDPLGIPVLFFHSINSSRLELLSHKTLFSSMGIRLICLDRPGYGYSHYQQWEQYKDYAQDTINLLDHLGLERVGILSCSAGSPHALSFSLTYPERVTQVNCISAVPTPEFVLAAKCPSALNDTLSKFFRVVPGLMRPALELTLIGETAEGILRNIGTGKRTDIFTYSELDIAHIKSPENLPYFSASMTESLRQGPQVWANENILVNRNWGFELADIKVPVMFWHGTQDTLIPLEMVEPFVETIPDASLHVLNGETHMLIFRHLESILSTFK